MDKFLEQFKSINREIVIKEETDNINLENLWNDETFICRYSNNQDFSAIENTQILSEFSGIFHKNTGILEFIFTVLPKGEEIIKRNFKFHFEGNEFEAFFSEPSESIKLLASGFRANDIPSDTNYRNLRVFYDFYKNNQSDGLKKFFEDKEPINFFIKGDFSKIKYDFKKLAKHLNFYMKYFDRRSPHIIVFNPTEEKEEFSLPCHTDSKNFPEIINARKIEPVILDLLHVATDTTNIRLKYIFYYQILEYCSYYHLNEELKRKLNNVVKNPDVLSNSSHYSRQIIEEFKNYFKSNDDKQKLEKLILDYCEYDNIKIEIKSNSSYFAKDITFDGGFVLSSLIKNEVEAENPSKDILKNIVDRIDKIRNVLVHIRESRENKVILPTENNSHQLIPYLYLIRRIAEIIAIKYE